ncbi:hypothetical protein F0562_011554 [Nyssa sinensis]|uniref:Uncharacterized protein n=1 Tax=Nyssa sinensis TaxID=561372 RepID=A0A5J4ZUT5_9ASTE|nr:hypothetical protein F0562_011554 [Nyssa sinensis]
MDAIELPLPAAAAAAVSKLIGSDGFGGAGGVGVAIKEVEDYESDHASTFVGPSDDRRSSLLSQKDEVGTVNASETAFWNKMPDAELCRHASQPSSFHIEDASEDLYFGSTNSSLLLKPTPEAKKSQRKTGKAARSSSGCSKRSRMAQMEVPINEHGVDDIKDISNELGAYPAKCNITEKTQLAKQKNNLNGKRGDKKNNKVPMKSKCNSFSLKAGLLSFSSSAGGNNILGVYDLKQDICDVTKHVDDLLLNELLDGSYKCPGFAKEKGKKAANLNENIMNLVKQACYILRLQKPTQPQNFAEINTSYNQEVSTCPVSSVSCIAGRSDSNKGGTYTTDHSSCNKFQDSRSDLKSPASMLDFPLYRPEDILERLALPQPRDLESLLLDAAKPALSSRNNTEPRLGKSVFHRAGLPPFPWSHTSSGHCKSNTDAVKLSTSRSTCQGRWVKMESSATSEAGSTTNFLVDFGSLAYDHSLVPSAVLKSGPLENGNASSTSHSFPSCERGLSSSTTCSIASQVPPEAGVSLKYQGNAEYSPRLLAAAQTLYEITTHSLKQDPRGLIRWPKKPSQKAMKTRKLKSDEKSEEIFTAPKIVIRSGNLVKNANEILPSKKPRLSLNEKTNDDLYHTKVPVTWSTSRSSRSFPSKSLRDSVLETKHYNSHIVKHSCMLPPPTRVWDKACKSQQKLRKLVPMEWDRTGGKLD